MNIKSIIATTSVVAVSAFSLAASNASADTIKHTVQAGETLSSISDKYLGSAEHVKNLASINQIKNADLIYAGQEITLDTDNMTISVDAPSETTPSVTVEAVSQEPAQPVEQVQELQEATPSQTQEVAQSIQPATQPNSDASYSGQASSAKEWIAQRESSGSYSASNGQYVGRYQLDASYLNGDYSEANQEKVADNYVSQRYGSWENAQQFWLQNGWY